MLFLNSTCYIAITIIFGFCWTPIQEEKFFPVCFRVLDTDFIFPKKWSSFRGSKSNSKWNIKEITCNYFELLKNINFILFRTGGKMRCNCDVLLMRLLLIWEWSFMNQVIMLVVASSDFFKKFNSTYQFSDRFF